MRPRQTNQRVKPRHATRRLMVDVRPSLTARPRRQPAAGAGQAPLAKPKSVATPAPAVAPIPAPMPRATKPAPATAADPAPNPNKPRPTDKPTQVDNSKQSKPPEAPKRPKNWGSIIAIILALIIAGALAAITVLAYRRGY